MDCSSLTPTTTVPGCFTHSALTSRDRSGMTKRRRCSTRRRWWHELQGSSVLGHHLAFYNGCIDSRSSDLLAQAGGKALRQHVQVECGELERSVIETRNSTVG